MTRMTQKTLRETKEVFPNFKAPFFLLLQNLLSWFGQFQALAYFNRHPLFQALAYFNRHHLL